MKIKLKVFVLRHETFSVLGFPSIIRLPSTPSLQFTVSIISTSCSVNLKTFLLVVLKLNNNPQLPFFNFFLTLTANYQLRAMRRFVYIMRLTVQRIVYFTLQNNITLDKIKRCFSFFYRNIQSHEHSLQFQDKLKNYSGYQAVMDTQKTKQITRLSTCRLRHSLRQYLYIIRKAKITAQPKAQTESYLKILD